MKMHILNAGPNDELAWSWDQDTSQIEEPLFLDLKLAQIDPYDQAYFQANIFAIEQFVKCFPEANSVILGKIDGPFSKIISTSPLLEEEAKEEGLRIEIFCAQILSDYLHRLISFLPHSCRPRLFVDLVQEKEHSTKSILALSLRRFSHMELLFASSPLPIRNNAQRIISLPQDGLFCAKRFSQYFDQVEGDYQCVPEELLNENWDGVETIYFEKKSLGQMGERMLLGFEAAGGAVTKLD